MWKLIPRSSVIPNEIAPHELARLTIEEFVTVRAIIESPSKPTGVLASRAGTFVTLRALDGQLRGCIGTVEATRANVAEEIIHNAIMAATSDPRFAPVTKEELSCLSYGVDVLSAPEHSKGPEDLDPSRFGVIIETLDHSRRGLLLPLIDGIETIEQQWVAVHHKAGIRVGERVTIERFTVTRFGKLTG